MFLEYQSPREAEEAVKGCDGYKLDKQHTFQVNLFTDFEKYKDIPDEWVPPQPQQYKDPVKFGLAYSQTNTIIQQFKNNCAILFLFN